MTLAMRYRPNAGINTLQTAAGNRHPVGGAATVDVPFSDDALTIGPDQATPLIVTGNTADRPVNVLDRQGYPMARMYDLTLGKVIFLVRGSWPASWIDVTGAAV
jgi:hypothetical protein